MLKVDILSRRRPDLTHEQFVEHWRDLHGPLFSCVYRQLKVGYTTTGFARIAKAMAGYRLLRQLP
jgi:hypothetical protein